MAKYNLVLRLYFALTECKIWDLWQIIANGFILDKTKERILTNRNELNNTYGQQNIYLECTKFTHM